MKFFSGTANVRLSELVAKKFGTVLSSVEVVRFENSEVRVTVQEEVKGETCVIIQPIANPSDTNLMELLLMCDALRREEAKKVIGIIPYFGYARQNIQHRAGECVSANVIIRFMESIGFHKIFTMDIHDEATAGVFTIPFKDISTLPALAKAIKKDLAISEPLIEEFAIVSPDQGGIERARKFGVSFFGHNDFHMAVTEKKRDSNRIHKSIALDLYGDVKNKIVVIVDDIATSAGTLVHSAELCKKHGAKKMIAAICHRDLSPKAPSRIMESSIDSFYTTNTVSLTDAITFNKMVEVDISHEVFDHLNE